MPVEVMAKRGEQTLVFGPLKPVGLVNPKTGKDDAYAVVQLRQDNKEGTLYNLVGFQTNLKWGEQKRVFSMIPGLENAEFVRYGVMHRNTYINSPTLLNKYYQMKKYPKVFFAGQRVSKVMLSRRQAEYLPDIIWRLCLTEKICLNRIQKLVSVHYRFIFQILQIQSSSR